MKNKNAVFMLVLLLSVAGCGRQNKKAEVRSKDVATNVDIPVAGDGVKSFFDEEVGGFATEVPKNVAEAEVKPNDFAWEDVEQGQFKAVYFDFDGYGIREDQQGSVAHNVEQIKTSIAEAEKKGIQPVVVIEGHACHSAGSSVYNLALSEKRAKVLADALAEHGVSRDAIRIVGRGKEVPALVNGKPVSGDRSEQWPNRRDEVRVIFN